MDVPMHREHRERFARRLRAERAAAIVPTATEKLRNGDSHYRYRPDSDFWYLTGFGEPDAWLIVLPFGTSSGDGAPSGDAETVLFLRPKNPAEEVWTGRRLGVEAAVERLGIDRALPVADLWKELPALLRGYERVLYRAGDDERRDAPVLELLARLRRRARKRVPPPVEIVDPLPILHELRLRKGPAEIERMRAAAAISVEAHLAAMQATEPGRNEREIEALVEYTFRRRGADAPAYTSIVAGGDNACILHYVTNDRELADGELLLIDAGAELGGYASDVTRTFPINGTFSPAQRALYEVVLRAQKRTVDAVEPGRPVTELGDIGLRALVEGLCELGLLSGSVDDAIEDEAYRRFYMHGIGHWLGLDVHDCGAYSQGGEVRALAPGMVTTVEPGLYVAPDDETVDERWRGIGIRIEDDVLVTADGHENLTAALPKEIDEVEAACRGSLEVAATASR